MPSNLYCRHFLKQLGSPNSNTKLYNSILALQNEIVINCPSNNKVLGIVSVEDELYSAAIAKALVEFYEIHEEKTLLLNVNMHNDIMPIVFEGKDYQVLEKMTLGKTSKEGFAIYKTLGLEEFSSEVLHSEEFKAYMQKVREHYDHVVLMLPPIPEYRDVLLLKDVMDCAVLITKRDRTEVSKIYECVNFLKKNEIPLATISVVK